MTTTFNVPQRLERRRRELAMTFPALSHRSGVSEPTIKRMLGGKAEDASFAKVKAVAIALGVSIQFGETDPEELRRNQAMKKAEAVARLVQGTSALESQAVDEQTVKRLVERTYHELLAGSSRRLWSA
ncbi:MAG: hypothetical protein SH850_02075 [Planctomycetaceae bacterium]|nr:hypothetical protein [Planctomycetaceae bacterium]